MVPRYFWDAVCIALLLINTSGECGFALDFRLKMTSCACFFRIWVETHFPLKRPSIYLCQVAIQFKSRGIVIMITENKDALSANSLAFEDNPSDKSLIYIENNNRPSMEPCGTPALTSDQSKTSPFNKTLCFLFLRKLHKRFSKLPNISFCFNSKMRPQYQTLSNAFDISRKIPLTSTPKSNDLYIS